MINLLRMLFTKTMQRETESRTMKARKKDSNALKKKERKKSVLKKVRERNGLTHERQERKDAKKIESKAEVIYYL